MVKTIRPAKNKPLLDALKGHNTLNLITYYPSGKAVATPLEFLELGGKIYARTRTSSYKLKRIAKNPRVRVFASNQRGSALGPEVEARARILNPDKESALISEVMAAFKIRNPLLHPLMLFVDQRRGHSRNVVEISQ